MFIESNRPGGVKAEAGQSTIEFILSFIVSFGFLIVFLKLALMYTEGYLVHYSNFVASRAYMVFENNSNDPAGGDLAAENLAREVFQRFAPAAFDGEFAAMEPRSNPRENVFVGTFARYQRNYAVPMAIGSAGELDLISESFLGREPNRAECLERVCASMRDLGVTSCSTDVAMFVTLADNGC